MRLRVQLAPPGDPQPRAWTEALWRHELHAPIAAAFLGSAEVYTLASLYKFLISDVRALCPWFSALPTSWRSERQAAQLFAFVASGAGPEAELHLTTDVGTWPASAVYLLKGAGAVGDASTLQARMRSVDYSGWHPY